MNSLSVAINITVLDTNDEARGYFERGDYFLILYVPRGTAEACPNNGCDARNDIGRSILADYKTATMVIELTLTCFSLPYFLYLSQMLDTNVSTILLPLSSTSESADWWWYRPVRLKLYVCFFSILLSVGIHSF